MSSPWFTLDDLRIMLREEAGTAEHVDLDGDILDVKFQRLGYESLALLATGGRIERTFDITLDDTTLTAATTPRVLIQIVNALLGG
jgi:act minimal PKS acyl carrier protein